MKIGVRKVGPLGHLYDDKYDSRFFESLWKNHLLLKLSPDDEVVWFDRMPVEPEGFDFALGDLEAVIGAWIFDNMITDEMLSKHPNLKYIGTISHGYSEFDKIACRNHGVTVTNTHFNDYAVAQHTMALLLEITNNIGINSEYYKDLKWEDSGMANNKLFTRQTELQNKTFGIIGLGSIGLLVAKMAAGFGMKVMSYSKHYKGGNEYSFIRQVELNTLLQSSDIISLHCSSNKDTQKIINERSIKLMKDGVILLNCARGDLIDEEAVYNALNSGGGGERLRKNIFVWD